MEGIVQSLAVLISSLAILLFFGPIIVIISIIGNVRLGPLNIDLSNSRTSTRVLLAVVGISIWIVVYVPLVSLAFRSIGSTPPNTGTSTQVPPSPSATVTNVASPSPTELPTLLHSETPTPVPTGTPTAILTREVEPTNVLIEMIRVPQGWFSMGSSYTDAFDFDPAHNVFVSEFYIDKYEVINAQYSQCVEEGVCSAPFLWNSNTREHYYDDSVLYGNHPVIYVTWNDASTFCSWRNARLPTEAEWEKAASWNPLDNETTIFPWGNENPDFMWVNFQSKDTNEVGSYPDGASHLGVFEMAGNALEWVADYYSPTYYETSPARDPSGPLTSTANRVARGGAWSGSEISSLWVFSRFYFSEDTARNDLGFRCARDIAP